MPKQINLIADFFAFPLLSVRQRRLRCNFTFGEITTVVGIQQNLFQFGDRG